jgi:hypothetical protein
MADGNEGNSKELPAKLASLIRMASLTAANSAPDCLAEIKQAMSNGVNTEQVQLCLATAKMVRKNAITFSDQEISDKFHFAEADIPGACCPVTAKTKNTAGCSCG